MAYETVEFTLAKNVPQKEVEEKEKTFMILMGKAFVNSARENMKKEREVKANANDN